MDEVRTIQDTPYTVSNMVKKRIAWIDCAKGIAILLTVIGHVFSGTGKESIMRGMIFSFHMPLFFILSARTTHFSRDAGSFFCKIRKSARHLLIPAAVIVVLTAIFFPPEAYNWEYFRGLLYTVLFSSGVKTSFAGITIRAIGIPWFLVCLFLGRAMYDYLQMKLNAAELFITCAIASTLGVLLGSGQWLPFSLDIALSCMLFFYAGDKMKALSVEKSPWKMLFISACVWMITLYFEFPDPAVASYLELAGRRYPI